MPDIELTGLSEVEAECRVARIWCILEAYHLATPAIAVKSHDGNLLSLSITFRSAMDAELVKRALSSSPANDLGDAALSPADERWKSEFAKI